MTGVQFSFVSIVHIQVRPQHYIRSILPRGPVGSTGAFRCADQLLEVNQLIGLKSFLISHRPGGFSHLSTNSRRTFSTLPELFPTFHWLVGRSRLSLASSATSPSIGQEGSPTKCLEVKNADDKKTPMDIRQKKKPRMGQNVEWKKRRPRRNVEWKKR